MNNKKKPYLCNYIKNKPCRSHNCQTFCKHTTHWEYAYKTPSNYLKRLINIFRGFE